MGEARPTYMGDFARPIIGATTSAIVLPAAVRNYNLKPNDSSLLPLFYGLPNEDAMQFIRDFCTQVQTFPLLDLTEEQLKLKCFTYALKDRARTWLLSLPPNSITSWGGACEKFMLKFYPNHKTQEIRTQIMNFMQGADEPFHEAWERFQELIRQCPQHQLAPVMLMQFFYDGLVQTAQFMVDSTAGGNIARKTVDELKEIIRTLAESSQQKTVRGRKAEASAVAPSYELQKQVADMRRELQQLKMSEVKTPPTREPNVVSCGRPYERGVEVLAAQEFSGWQHQDQGQGFGKNSQLRQPLQPMGYQNHPPQQQFPMQQGNFQQPQPYQNVPQQFQKPSLEDTMQSFMEMTKQTMESQSATIRRLETTVGQLTGALNQLQQQQPIGEFPIQDQQPYKAHAVAVVKENAPITMGKWRSKTVEAIKATQGPSEPLPPATVALDQPPPKQGDPGSFIFDISLGGVEKVSGMLDLGAAVNLMPLVIFEKLGGKELRKTDMKIELADGSISSPRGLVEDVEVVVRGIRVLVDFVVLDVGKGIRGENGHRVLLGRPFMATTHTRINVKTGTVSMAGAGRSVTFSAFDNKSTIPISLLQNCSYVEVFDVVDEDRIVQEFLYQLQDEDEIMQEFLANWQDDIEDEQEFLANLQDCADFEQEFLDKPQENEDKEQGLLCALLLEEKLDEVVSLDLLGCVDRRSFHDMSVESSSGGPAAAIEGDGFTRVLRQMELQWGFG